MDRRLKLTAKQKELVKNLEKAFAALEKEHVDIIFDMYLGEFRLFNNAESLGIDMSNQYSSYQEEYLDEPFGDELYDDDLEETEKGCLWYSPNQDDLETFSIAIILTDGDQWFAVKLKENEDSDAFFRGKKIEELEKEVKKNQKNLKRYLNNIEQAESNIHIFKEKGLPQDLIDEEQASILSYQEAVDKYQKVIDDLECEIQKLKEA